MQDFGLEKCGGAGLGSDGIVIDGFKRGASTEEERREGVDEEVERRGKMK